MREVLEITDRDEFQAAIDADPRVLVKFTAPAWCGPCIQFAPHYAEAARRADIPFVAVDVDHAPWANMEYGIMAVPTVLMFTNGEAGRRVTSRSIVPLLNEIKE